MNIEKEIIDLKQELDRLDCELEEVGLLLNSRGELSKIMGLLLEMKKDLDELKSKPDYRIKLGRIKNGRK